MVWAQVQWISISRIVDDCKVLMQAFEYCTVRHMRRETNSVADRLACFASKGHIVDPILHHVPDCIQDVLFEDYCNVTHLQGD